MSGNFGHLWARGGGVCIDAWGAGPFVIKDARGKDWRFEDSDQFGPSIVNKRGDILDRQPGERSAFWRPHWLWVRQGRKTEADGMTCIWKEPKATIYALRGREIVVTEQGDPDGEHLLDGKPLSFGDGTP